MSQTSKVNEYVRNTIVKALTPTIAQKQEIIAGRASLPTMSNSHLQEVYFFSLYSRRAIQEATQKLAVEGILVSQGRGTYSLSQTAAGIAVAATASN